MSLCMMDGCEGALEARGLCQKHYLRQWKYGDPNTVLAPTITHGLSIAERLEFHSKLNPDTGCIEWQGSLGGNGYARLEIAPDRRRQQAHRLAYEINVGPIPDGMVIDHLCRNRKCINHKHLEVVTIKQNVLRGIGISAKNANKTHCLKGHPLSGDNLSITRGHGREVRRCKTCANAASLACYYRKKAAQ
jgi:hypothetical protein